MNEIAFTKDYLKKFEYWFFPIGIAIWVIVFSTLNISREDRFCLSSFLMSIPVYILFYLIRFDPKFIEFDRDNINVYYINDFKWLFGKKDFRGYRREIKATKNDDIIILSNTNGIVAKIRRKALGVEDWNILNEYFS